MTIELQRAPLASARTLSDRRFISLFSGSGGLDLGLTEAGWQKIASVEMDADAVGTLHLAAGRREKVVGYPESLILQKKIEDVDPSWLRRKLGLRKRELKLLAGGPPCQPFTTHGLRQSISDARASGVWPTYLEYVSEFQPKSLIIENVDGLLSAALVHRPIALRDGAKMALEADERKGSFLLWLIKELSERGYALTWGLAEAADYGVPQYRQRSIIIGIRGGTKPCFLPPGEFGGPRQPPFRTLRQAVSELQTLGAVQPLSKRKEDVYRKIPAGGNWRDLAVADQQASMGRAHLASGGKSGWWRRLAWDKPTPTILGMPDHSSTALVHPDEVRCLSVNECAAAQSFPPETAFAGNARSQYQQIGNAVPPLLAQAVGTQLMKYLSGHKLEKPDSPAWRKASANRRIGTHGWTVHRRAGKPLLFMNTKIRDDHVWADLSAEDSFELN